MFLCEAMGGMIAQELCLIDYEMSKKTQTEEFQNSSSLFPHHNNSNTDTNTNTNGQENHSENQRIKTNNRTSLVKSVVFAVTHAGGLCSLPPFSTMWRLTLGWLRAQSPIQEAQFFLPTLYSSQFLSLPFSEYLQRVEEQERSYFKRTYPRSSERENPPTELTTNSFRTVFDFLVAEWTKKGKINTLGCLHQMGAIMRHYLTVEQLTTLGSHIPHILIISASEDQLIRPENSRQLHRLLPHAVFVECHSGHMVHIECEVEFNALVFQHLLHSISTLDIGSLHFQSTSLSSSLFHSSSNTNNLPHSSCK
jgi:hypothetical protein